MTDLRTEIESLIHNGLLPDREYVSAKRFINHYANTNEFWAGLALVGITPIINGLYACYYASRTVWATLRTVGNLLILKPGLALDALKDVGCHLTLSTCLLLMAPIHALTHAVEILTRVISSWFVGQEPRHDLLETGLMAKWANRVSGYQMVNELPSSNYLNKARFFSSYNNAWDCLEQMASPMTSLAKGGFHSLVEALYGVESAIECIVNLAICKPLHAKENFHNLQVHFGLAVSLAVMTPINALVEGIAFMTRLGTTWVSACLKPEVTETEHENTTAYQFN